jgi:hypothetical protein
VTVMIKARSWSWQRLLLALTAALLAFSTSVHADWNTRFKLPDAPLPKEMLGTWCLDETADNERLQKTQEYNTTYYTRRDECLNLEVPLIVRPDGYDEVWDNCPFTKVEKEPNGGYLIYSYCEFLSEGGGHGMGEYFSKHMEYRIAENGQLVVTQIPET